MDEFNARQIADNLGVVRDSLPEVADDLKVRISRAIRERDREIERLRSMLPVREVVKPDPDQREKAFEAGPRKSALEQVLCRLSICTTTREPTGTTAQAEITEAEFAGMLAGMPVQGGDRLLRELAELIAWAYLGYPHAMGRLIVHLDTWGRQRVLFRHPELRVTGSDHRRVAKVVAQRHIQRSMVKVEDMRRAMGLSERRWPLWRGWVDDMTKRIDAADSALARHLRSQLFDKMSESDFHVPLD